MKKTVFILLMSMITIYCLTAQSNYKSLLKSVDEWHFATQAAIKSSNSGIWYTGELFLQKDTILNNLSYKTIVGEYVYSDIGGFIREDTTTKEVFYMHPNDTSMTEYQIYDFSLNVGDSIQLFGLLNGSGTGFAIPQFFSVDSIKIINIMGEDYKAFFLSSEYYNLFSGTTIWIEGIGSLGNLINSGFPYYIEYANSPDMGFLLCCYNNGALIYQNELTTDCTYTNMEELKSDISISLFPNPSSDYLTIKTSIEPIRVVLINQTGEVVLMKTIKFFSEIINISTLPAGIYIVKIYDENQNSFHRKLIIQQ